MNLSDNDTCPDVTNTSLAKAMTANKMNSKINQSHLYRFRRVESPTSGQVR